MKKYSVNILFENGYKMNFETDTNVLLQKPIHINGVEMIVTEEGEAFNKIQVENLTVRNNVKV